MIIDSEQRSNEIKVQCQKNQDLHNVNTTTSRQSENSSAVSSPTYEESNALKQPIRDLEEDQSVKFV